jgi:fatty acid desaturase
LEEIKKIRNILRDLMTPNAVLYWADFLFTIFLAWSSFVFAYLTGNWWIKSGLMIVTIFCLYRAMIFTHELAHVRPAVFLAGGWADPRNPV